MSKLHPFVGYYYRTRMQHYLAMLDFESIEEKKEYLERVPSDQRDDVSKMFPELSLSSGQRGI